MNYDEYAAAFDEVQKDFEQTIESYGLPFEESETQPRSLRADAAAEHKDNGLASLWSGWISSACTACRIGEETATFFVSLKCTKNCYFCFNPNQEDYDYFLTHKRDIASELRAAHAAGARFRHLAITGGEPCLHKAEVLEFLRCAKELYPGVHVRMYTSGDLLDDSFLADLSAAGLDEVRFSVKPDALQGLNACDLPDGVLAEADVSIDESSGDTTGDTAGDTTGVADKRPGDAHATDASSSASLFACMKKAVAALPHVMVEMPVIPGTLPQMKELLLQLDALGLQGINLLEFCFPLHNAKEFARRGFRIRKNPYARLYNYWYGGGLPIAGSETECLELLQFARDAKLNLGVHYCSLDNKLTGQIYQQNKLFLEHGAFAQRHAWLAFDKKDYFLKCAKVFGDDVEPACQVLADLTQGEWQSKCSLDSSIPSLAFPLEWAACLQEQLPQAKIGISVNVLEPDGESFDSLSDAPVRLHVREVSLEQFA